MAWHERHYNREDSPGFGGGGLMSRLSGSAVVTWLLAGNFIIFVLDSILSTATRAPSWASLSYWGNFNVEQGIFGFQIWRWFTYQFLHANFFHLLFNMIGLFFFGPMMEQWWGSRRFLVFYVLCGMAGAVIYSALVLLAPDVIFSAQFAPHARLIPLVGASGAIFGILAGCATLFPHQRVMLLIPPIPMSMRTMALIFLGIAALSLILGADNAGGQAAHLGGALLGFVLVKRARWLDWADRGSLDSMKHRYQQKISQRQKQQQAATEAEVDRILDKVRQNGLHSLTRAEQKTLKRATEQKRGR